MKIILTNAFQSEGFALNDTQLNLMVLKSHLLLKFQ